MIVDIYNEVFTSLKTALTGIQVSTTELSETSVFPCVTFDEISNLTNRSTIDSGGENHNILGFEINIFSNATNKHTQIRSIRKSVDEVMADKYGCTRNDCGYTPNYSNSDIYKYTLRYDCIVDKNKQIFRG